MSEMILESYSCTEFISSIRATSTLTPKFLILHGLDRKSLTMFNETDGRSSVVDEVFSWSLDDFHRYFPVERETEFNVKVMELLQARRKDRRVEKAFQRETTALLNMS